jgi:CRP/FNR family cyclic AMP-dependent transcriptional regulator
MNVSVLARRRFQARDARMTQPSLSVIPDMLLRQLAERGRARRFPAQTVLFSEGDASDSLYVLLAGRVKVYGSNDKGREVIYNTHGPAESFGELALDGGIRSASVMTLEPCSIVVVPGAEVRAFMAEHPDFAWHLVRKLAAMLRRSTLSVRSLALQDVYGRLIGVLLELAREHAGLRSIDPAPTQQEIAERVGSSREMVSRILTTLVVGGHLKREGRRLVLLKPLPAHW